MLLEYLCLVLEMVEECQASRDFHLAEKFGMVIGHERVGDAAVVLFSCEFHIKGA